MPLPIRTTVKDVETVCAYLLTKPTGATLVEAKAVLDSKVLDGRKRAALKFWSLIEEDGDKMRLTEAGRQLAKDKGARRAAVIRNVIAEIKPYAAAVEKAVHSNELTVAATEVAANWHQHFKSEASSNSDKILNDQAVCFFQLAEAADLGQMIVGRKGQPTRFEFDEETAGAFVQDGGYVDASDDSDAEDEVVVDEFTPAGDPTVSGDASAFGTLKPKGNRVFITHGKNKKILEEVKEIVAYGKFEPVVAQEHETAAKPVPEKVMDDMRSCDAAVIHVGAEGVLYDKDNNEYPQINSNVLIEIGAAMALYGRNFILLVEDGVKLPSNLQGLYKCQYEGDQLGAATIKLLKAFNDFK